MHGEDDPLCVLVNYPPKVAVSYIEQERYPE